MVRKLEAILADRARAEQDDRSLVSRSDIRRERRAVEITLIDLARRLCALKTSQLARLELPETLLHAVEEAAAIRSPVARNRAEKRVRQELRDVDVSELSDQLSRFGPSKARQS